MAKNKNNAPKSKKQSQNLGEQKNVPMGAKETQFQGPK